MYSKNLSTLSTFKKLSRSIALTAALSAGLGATALLTSTNSFADADLSKVPAGAYSVDPTHAYISFQYSHLGLSNPILSFDDFTINMNLDITDPTKTTVTASIDPDSVLTGSDAFHSHLTGAKWFNVAENPEISFTSTSISGSGSNFQMTGDLTIKGMTKPITLDVTLNAAMNHPMNKKPVVGISASGKLMRSDWGLGANAPYISDEVTLNIQAEMFAD